MTPASFSPVAALTRSAARTGCSSCRGTRRWKSSSTGDGHWGRLMMCSTASVQVCVDAGLDDDGTSGCAVPLAAAARARPGTGRRFRELAAAARPAHRLEVHPPAGLVQARSRANQVARWRRAPAGLRRLLPAVTGSEAAREHWVRYAMDADVLCVRKPDGQPWTVPAGLTFRDWLRGSGQTRAPGRQDADVPAPPTVNDLDYHLSTLFPPVRPRGHLELRMIDAQPGEGWIVPVSVVAALTDDPVAADAAMAATEPVWQNGGSGRGEAAPVPRQLPSGRGRETQPMAAGCQARAGRPGLGQSRPTLLRSSVGRSRQDRRTRRREDRGRGLRRTVRAAGPMPR